MGVFSKSGGKATSMPMGFFCGGLTSLAVTLALSAILSWLVLIQKLQQDQIGYGIMILLVLASFSGAKVSYGKIKRQKLLVSMVSGAVYFGSLLSVTALFFGGQYNGVGETALMILCGSGLAILLQRNKNIYGSRNKMKKGYR